MISPASIESALTRPGNLVFPSNRTLLPNFEQQGGRAVRLASGHLVFYGPHGRRILATDPAGHPLHECEWASEGRAGVRLLQARLCLDWGRWVGIKPSGLATTTTLDLSKKPGWERIQPDDLRRMAAQALRVPLEEVRFFYNDQDLQIDGRGQATIRHRKDALYVLEKGTFEGARFMACLAAMHWERIDFLPVVELFQSLLPGTGSAAFELIRGLYDDQNPALPRPLRYRGIPTYPSEAAYRLFSGFFTPQHAQGGNPLPVFMDQARSHEVTWLPVPDPPRRYFDPSRFLCLTIKGDRAQKATLAHDSTGLSYTAAGPGGMAPAGRSLWMEAGTLILQDGDRQEKVPVQPHWGKLQESPGGTLARTTTGWRALFGGSPPAVSAADAFGAVLLYPEDGAEIGEAATQPFVADYLQDAFEQEPGLQARLQKAERVLVQNFDAALLPCLHLDRPRRYTVRYCWPPYAQKQAQTLWNQLARAGHLDWARQIQFSPSEQAWPNEQGKTYDLVYQWVPFAWFSQEELAEGMVQAVAQALSPWGVGFLVGPQTLAGAIQSNRLRLLFVEAVEKLPTVQMHRSILPQARIKAGLTLFQVAKS